MLPGLVETLGRALFRDRRTIGFWWWEVDRLPPVMGWASHLVDEIWVGSEHVRGAIAPGVSKPVYTFPVPIVRPRIEAVDRAEFEIPGGRFAFIFSFNFWSIFERKNPLGLIEAFSRAFSPNEGPVLVLKTIGGKSYRRQLRDLHAAAASREDVIVLEQGLPAERYHGLIATCDAYASLHRAEGFGLTIAEAMALGKPAVATGYSGNLEFMTDLNSYLVPTATVPIPAGLEPYAAGGVWADPELDAAASLLRRVVERPEEARAKADQALTDIAGEHGFESAAGFIRDRLAAPVAPREVPRDTVERAAYELMWGPDLELARPWARRLRGALRPFLRPYIDHQRRVSGLLLEAMRETETRKESNQRGETSLEGKDRPSIERTPPAQRP